MHGLSIQHISKSFGGKPTLSDVSFDIAPGQVSALLGPSGCGKSTLLSLVAGLDDPGSGEIYWNGASLRGIPAHKRGFGLMFQDYALFPHMNVAQNLAFGLRMAALPQNQIRQRVEQTLEMVGLASFGSRDIHSLSGGEQQRVALARSLAPQPRFLMLDEPLGALDRTLRERLLVELNSILRRLGQTALYVTHDQEEAFSLADQVIILNAGQVEQIGAPQAIYRQPGSTFVARFLGMTNLIAARRIDAHTVDTPIGRLPVAQPLPAAQATLLIRPDAVLPGESGPVVLQGVVVSTAFRGAVCRATVLVNGQNLVFDLPPGACLPGSGAAVSLSFDPQQALQAIER